MGERKGPTSKAGEGKEGRKEEGKEGISLWKKNSGAATGINGGHTVKIDGKVKQTEDGWMDGWLRFITNLHLSKAPNRCAHL